MVPRALYLALLSLAAMACAPVVTNIDEGPFTVVMLPDTQHMINVDRQKAQGFAIDSSELFLGQMRYIAENAEENGGNVVFVAAVGDVWEHASIGWDADHSARDIVPEPGTVHRAVNPDAALNHEIPKAIEGYSVLSNAGVRFGISPGNHDYDAWWQVEGSKPNSAGRYPVHFGGLDKFRESFGSNSKFYKDKDWYIGSFRGGANSAQVFSGGGYRFLHLALEMQPGDEVLAWADGVIADHPDLPTIVTMHDYMDTQGDREYVGTNLVSVDPEYHNSREELWQNFISKTDQIFMVLCGHKGGQALRIDKNDYGHAVVQILADYQDRGQAGLDAGQPIGRNGKVSSIGDGWLREMVFHIDGDKPRIDVKTYSSHYGVYSSELATYAEWYKANEQPDMTDEEFASADEFTIELSDFHARFSLAK